MKSLSILVHARGATMNRAIVALLSAVLASAWPVAAAADGQQTAGTALTKLMVLFSWSTSRFTIPKQVVSPEKDWTVVKDAQSQRAARIERDRQLREARERIEERERELRIAREAYRRETSRIVQVPESDARLGTADHVTQDARVLMAERRLSEREREAYKAKLEYSQAARAIREQRRLEAQNAASGG